MKIDILTKDDLNSFKKELVTLIKSASKPEAEYISKKEAKEILGCGESKLEQLRNERYISFAPIGREYRYKLSSLHNYLEQVTINSV